jgi:hypothetical protein
VPIIARFGDRMGNRGSAREAKVGETPALKGFPHAQLLDETYSKFGAAALMMPLFFPTALSS